MERGGTLAAILLFHLVLTQGQANVITSCTLSKTVLDALFLAPINPDKATDTPDSNSDVPLACEDGVHAAISALYDLSKSGRIVVPDEDEDKEILEQRFKEVNTAFENLKEKSDPQTTKYLEAIQPELQKFKDKIDERRSSPEYQILRVVFSGEAHNAAGMAENVTNNEEFVHRVIDQGFDATNTTFLKHLIEFSKEVSTFELSIPSYEQIFEKMEATGLLKDSPELLLLWYSAKSDSDDETFGVESEELKLRYIRLLQTLDQHKKGMVTTLIGDLGESNFSRFEQFKGFERGILNYILPEIVQGFYASGDLEKVKNVLELVRNLPEYTNDCVAIETLFQEMKSRGQEKTFEAFALWLSASYDLGSNDVLENIDDITELQKCYHVHRALSKYKVKHIDDYVKLVRGKKWLRIIQLHKSYRFTMNQILPLALERLFNKGRNEDVAEINTWADNLPHYEENCLLLHPFLKKLNAIRDFDSFELLQTFAILREALTKPLNSESINICRAGKYLSPKWIFDLVWGNTSSCTITNRQNNENLAVLGTHDLTTSNNGSQRWELKANANGFVFIEDVAQPEAYLSCKGQDVFLSNKTNDLRMTNVWRVDHVGDDFLSFYLVRDNEEKIFLTTDSDSCPGANTCLKLESKGDDFSAQWRVDCN